MAEEKRKNILLVEDDAISAIYGKTTLEKSGYEVLTAHSGEKAIEMVDSNPGGIDLVLMDINLGDGIDGTAAAEKILEKHELPLVFLSSHTEPEIVEKTDKITSYGYIVKNSGDTVLNASIKMAFRLFEARMEEKKKSDALLESEKRYHNIFNNCVEGLFQTTPEGRYRTINQAFARMFGYDSPAAMISAVTDIGRQLYVNPEDRRRLIALLNESKDGVVMDFEVELMRGDRTRFWVSINCRLMRDAEQNLPFIEGSCLDITGRRRAETALKESERNFREVIETSLDNIFVVEVCPENKFRVKMINNALEKYIPIDRNKIEGKFEPVR